MPAHHAGMHKQPVGGSKRNIDFERVLHALQNIAETLGAGSPLHTAVQEVGAFACPAPGATEHERIKEVHHRGTGGRPERRHIVPDLLQHPVIVRPDTHANAVAKEGSPGHPGQAT